MALKTNGTVYTWGLNDKGQLGNGYAGGVVIGRCYPVQVVGKDKIGYLTDIAAINAGRYHAGDVKKDGTVWGWGYNLYGQLGDNTVVTATSPMQTKGPGGAGVLTGASAIDAGGFHTAALLNDGTIFDWGNDSFGQLGNTTTAESHVPVTAQRPVTY